MDEDSGGVSGAGITTYQNIGVVGLVEVGIESCLTDRAPARLLFEQVDAIVTSGLPHQTPLPAIFPVVTQAWIEGRELALDLHEAGYPGFVVARKPEPAVTEDPAPPAIDAEVAVDYPVPCLVGMSAFGPPVGGPPHVVVQDAERALGDGIAVVVAPPPDHRGQSQITSAIGRCRFSQSSAESVLHEVPGDPVAPFSREDALVALIGVEIRPQDEGVFCCGKAGAGLDLHLPIVARERDGLSDIAGR